MYFKNIAKYKISIYYQLPIPTINLDKVYPATYTLELVFCVWFEDFFFKKLNIYIICRNTYSRRRLITNN